MLKAMFLVLMLLAGDTASAQPVGDGVALLRQVAEGARSAKGWRAQGTMEVSTFTLDGHPLLDNRTSFTISKRGPLESRMDLSGDVIVCDGVSSLSRVTIIRATSSQREEYFEKATGEACDPAASRWEGLLDSLQSAVLVGMDISLDCTVVRAEYLLPDGLGFYGPAFRPLPLDVREICVNERGVVRWERLEGTSKYRILVSLTYKEVERDPSFGPDEFKLPPYGPSAPDQWRRLLGDLPLYSCSGPSHSAGCVRNPFAFEDSRIPPDARRVPDR